MGKTTGFLEYDRQTSAAEKPKARIKHFNEFRVPLSKAEQQTQGARCMACGVPFCQSGQVLNGMPSGCPLHNLIPEWNDLVYHGNWEQAYKRLRKTNNFPEFTSRVCPALCEAACTCGLHGEPVTAKENEYGIATYAYANDLVSAKPPKVRTGKKIAVIGSGPSGLAAADQLNSRGHEVTVFERSDRVGGLLRYGIPNMKLEKEVIDRRVRIMEAQGVTFKTGCDVGTKLKAKDVLKEFDRVILACGASNPRDIKVPGREGTGIHFAVEYLSGVTKSLLDSDFKDGAYINTKGKNVMVIGGGDTGNDCVGTAIRQGASSVVQLEMMPEPPTCRAELNPWPEWPRVLKTDYGQEEAIAVFGQDPRVYQTTVKEFILNKAGAVTGAKVIKLESKTDEETGRMTMAEVAGSEYEIAVDYVFIAAGFLGSQSYVAKAFGVEQDGRTNIETRERSYQTSKEKVFAAGDMRRGQSLVVWAIREGREVAAEVDNDLMGYTNLSVQ